MYSFLWRNTSFSLVFHRNMYFRFLVISSCTLEELFDTFKLLFRGLKADLQFQIDFNSESEIIWDPLFAPWPQVVELTKLFQKLPVVHLPKFYFIMGLFRSGTGGDWQGMTLYSSRSYSGSCQLLTILTFNLSLYVFSTFWKVLYKVQTQDLSPMLISR